MTNEIRQSFTVIIVGGGPAGVSAAMGFLEARLDCLLIDQGAELGGQVLDIPSEIVNLPGGMFKNGQALSLALQSALARAQELAASDGSNKSVNNTGGTGDGLKTSILTVQRHCLVLSIEPGADSVVVETNKGNFVADYLLVATGYRPKVLEAPEGSRFAKHWHNHTDTLPDDLCQCSVAVVGGGDSALLKVISLAAQVREIHLIHRSKTFRARPDLVEEVKLLSNCRIHKGFEIVALRGEQTLEKIVLRDKENGNVKEINASEVIIKAGYEPNTELLQNKVRLDFRHHVTTGPTQSTSHPRIFAAGDIANERHPRIASAIGQGMMASGAIIEKVFAAGGHRQ
jgi:thioredoxin reductase (NADPH)